MKKNRLLFIALISFNAYQFCVSAIFVRMSRFCFFSDVMIPIKKSVILPSRILVRFEKDILIHMANIATTLRATKRCHTDIIYLWYLG